MGSGLKSLLADTSLCDRPSPPVVMEDFGIWNCEEDLPEWEILNAHSDLSVPGVAPTDHLPGVDPSGNQMKFSVSNLGERQERETSQEERDTMGDYCWNENG